jgi:hypothetical protein
VWYPVHLLVFGLGHGLDLSRKITAGEIEVEADEVI